MSAYQAIDGKDEVVEQAKEWFCARLPNDHLKFELFDCRHQLGVLYTNPYTTKRHALRIHLVSNRKQLGERVNDAVNELKGKTR